CPFLQDARLAMHVSGILVLEPLSFQLKRDPHSQAAYEVPSTAELQVGPDAGAFSFYHSSPTDAALPLTRT
ncbi:MAG: hypothetical protein KJ749_15075, partial [Planctomycetes bacterium]|nr:hypothetical protein [Planctomycetota bacterium]